VIMRIDIISVVAILYIVVTGLALYKMYSKMNKLYILYSLSGIILLGYSTVLYIQHNLNNFWYILVLALIMIQLSAFEAGKVFGRINYTHHIVRLVLHIILIYFMIFY
ncbi:hypothetical protein HZY83_05880, partial [Gemella sp. GH3]|uniref:hypothetical protein n=1 Tax=unclassified Gemella TaxID=2624949 RepID=UPI0015D04882